MQNVTPPMPLRERRSFGEKINATFEFIRLYFRPLFRSIAFISMPMVLLCAIAMSLSSSFFGLNSNEISDVSMAYSQLLSYYSAPSTIVIFLSMSIGFVLCLAVTYECMRMHMERENMDDFGLIWRRARSHIGRLIVGTIGNVLVIGTAALILGGVIGGLALLGTGGAVAALFLGMLVFLGSFILIAPLLLVYPIQVMEKKSYGKALVRTFQLVRGREWLATAGIAFIMLVIYYFFQVIFSLPFQIISFGAIMHSTNPSESIGDMQLVVILTYALSMIGYFFTTPIFWIGIAFQYFNLSEKRDQIGLLSEIDAIGQKPKEDYEEDQY